MPEMVTMMACALRCLPVVIVFCIMICLHLQMDHKYYLGVVCMMIRVVLLFRRFLFRFQAWFGIFQISRGFDISSFEIILFYWVSSAVGWAGR